jgi:lipopolysaccharide transport system permease protein
MTRSRLIIEAGKAEQHYWGDLWRYRELFYFLSWRDLLVRYKQTAIGVLWAVLRPVLTTAVFVFVFGRLAKMPSEGVPYPILVFSAMLPWQFFSSALTEASNSLVVNANMISKIYFPRLIVPASAIIVALGDFLISLVILAVMMAFYRILPTWHLFLLFPLVGIAFLAAFGAGLWLAALNVEYRDFRYVLPFIVQFGLYLSPVGFSSSIVPDKWRLLYSCNPMVGVIDGFRWAITGAESTIYWPGFGVSLLLVAVICVSGLCYFRKTERAFADVI